MTARRVTRMALAALALALLAPAGAGAQEPFRVTYSVDRSRPEHVSVSGRVANDGRVEALDVYVTAQALDASGRVIASGVTFVTGVLPAHGTAAYSTRIPSVPGIVSFRVSVSSYRSGLSPQAG